LQGGCGMTAVLIADDEPVSRRLLQATLQRWGYDVEVAHDGQEALESLLRDTAPRLAVLDCIMPRVDGLEVCRRARARPGAPYSYLLLLTSKEGRSDLVAGLEAGADDYIRKPFDAEELRARLRAGERILTLQAQLMAAQEALRVQATRDGLTALYNRTAFLQRLDEEMARAKRQGGELSVLLVDVDHFKRVNDRHGHQAGDDVLRQLTARLSAVLRTYDALGRYGGEELIAVLPGCGTAAALAVAERMRSAAASIPIATQTGAVTVTVSIGSASCTAGGTEPNALIARADAALYRAKKAGRNRVEAALPPDATCATGTVAGAEK
jgi:two-component system cell cycle response regulator